MITNEIEIKKYSSIGIGLADFKSFKFNRYRNRRKYGLWYRIYTISITINPELKASINLGIGKAETKRN